MKSKTLSLLRPAAGARRHGAWRQFRARHLGPAPDRRSTGLARRRKRSACPPDGVPRARASSAGSDSTSDRPSTASAGMREEHARRATRAVLHSHPFRNGSILSVSKSPFGDRPAEMHAHENALPSMGGVLGTPRTDPSRGPMSCRRDRGADFERIRPCASAMLSGPRPRLCSSPGDADESPPTLGARRGRVNSGCWPDRARTTLGDEIPPATGPVPPLQESASVSGRIPGGATRQVEGAAPGGPTRNRAESRRDSPARQQPTRQNSPPHEGERQQRQGRKRRRPLHGVTRRLPAEPAGRRKGRARWHPRRPLRTRSRPSAQKAAAEAPDPGAKRIEIEADPTQPPVGHRPRPVT